MKKFDKLFSDKKELATFKLFRQTFKGNRFQYSKVYHIKSFEYSDANVELFNKNKDDKDFYKILDKLEFNSQSNKVGNTT